MELESDLKGRDFFVKHSIKHENAQIANAILNIINLIIGLFESNRTGLVKSSKSLLSLLTGTDKKWWDNADNLKKEGLYVNFRNKKWSSPSNISDSEYNTSLDHAQNLVHWLKKAQDLIEGEIKTEKLLDALKKAHKKKQS